MSIITVNAGGSISSAITSAVSGDIIEVQAGATFDVSAPLTLKNHGSSSNPITIRSQNYASLPSGRIGPSDAANMPRIRATGVNGAFKDVSGGSYWILDGLEITDNSAVDISMLTDLRNGGKTKLSRIYSHPKETNPTWNRAAARAIWYEGLAGLTVEKSYYSGFLGYDLAGSALTTSEVLLSLGGKNVTITNNFLQAWYGIIFTGGGGNYQPDVTASLSGSPSTTGANFSTTTNLSVGQYVRVNFSGVGTKSGGTMTRTSGDAITAADVAAYNTSQGYGLSFVVSEAPGYVFITTAISGNDWTGIGGAPWTSVVPDGTVHWTAYEVVQIDTINAGTGAVTYHGVGPQAIVCTPTTTNTTMCWVVGDGSNPADWSITQNTFTTDVEFVNYLVSINYSLPQGKGIVEMKNMKRLTLDGNRFIGYPNSWFMREYNQDGSGPWSTVSDLIFTNNYFRTDDGIAAISGHAFSINLSDPYFSAQPGGNVTISNNLVERGWEGMSFWEGGTANCLVAHNTVISSGAGNSYHSVLTCDIATSSGAFTARDNIWARRNYGYQCLIGGGGITDCWPAGTWTKNLVVDLNNDGVTSQYFGTGGFLTPVPTSFSSVGFTNQSTGNYRLAIGSTYKGAGTNGSDPGIDQDALEAALGGTSGGGSSGGATTSNVRLFIQVR